MDKEKIKTLRLKKQEISLDKQPMDNAFIKREDNLKFYYCLYNLQDDFKDGFYFGLLQLHNQYPFAAPKLFMYTPNGRYQINMAICTSFTNYHQQSWTSAWNVRSLIQATISFMYSNEPSYGCRSDASQIRKKFARQSLGWNMNNQLFVRLFGQKIKQKLLDFVKQGIHIYHKPLIEILKSIGFIQNSKNNHEIQQTQIQQPQLIPIKNKIEDALNQPLIEYNQMDQLNLQQINVDIQRQKKELAEQRQKRKRQKLKKIMKIIGLLAFGVGAGVVVYYLCSKPGTNTTSSAQYSSNLVKLGQQIKRTF